MNLAASLTLAGRKVILIDGDLRKPEIGPSLGAESSKGLVSVLLGEARLDDALVTSTELGPDLKLLLAERTAPWTSEIFSLPTTQPLVDEAKSRADFVIIDSSPLSEVIDALPLAAAVDHVLVVVKLGRTRIGQLTQLGELMAENEIKPAGFAVVSAPRPARADYHEYAGRPRIVKPEDGRVPKSSRRRPRPGAPQPDAATRRDAVGASPEGPWPPRDWTSVALRWRSPSRACACCSACSPGTIRPWRSGGRWRSGS